MSARLEHLGRAIISGERRGALASLARAGLRMIEPLYACVMTLRNISYDAGFRVQRLPRPVISVGNITTGGTGKTPAVMWLAEQLRARGKQPAILLRGYRAAGAVGSDERRMLEDAVKVPVRAAPNRANAARRLLSESPQIDVLLLDDAFQHRKIARDFDLVLINASDPFGYDHVLPRGLLRESLRGLKRADAILLTHCDHADIEAVGQRVRQFTTAPIYHSSHRHLSMRGADQDLPMDELTRRRFYLFAGIGSPESFGQAMRAYGDNYAGDRWFTDHHDYREHDLAQLQRDAKAAGAEMLVTTEKDWVKLSQLPRAGALPIYRVELQLGFEDQHGEKLIEQIMTRLMSAA